MSAADLKEHGTETEVKAAGKYNQKGECEDEERLYVNSILLAHGPFSLLCQVKHM